VVDVALYAREGGLRIKDLSQIQPPENPTPKEADFWQVKSAVQECE
jgi:hypothetical protein